MGTKEVSCILAQIPISSRYNYFEEAQPDKGGGGRPSDTRADTPLAAQAQPNKEGGGRPSDTRAVTLLAAQAQPNKMGSGRLSDTRAVTRLAAQQQNKTK